MPVDSSFYVRPENVETTTSAGGIVIRKDHDRILVGLVKEGDLSEYILPKGKIEQGETLEQAARREILEEAGLSNLTLIKALGSRQRLSYNRNKWITVHYFLFITEEEGQAPTDPSHSYRCDWFPVDQLPIIFWPEQRQLIEENLEYILSI